MKMKTFKLIDNIIKLIVIVALLFNILSSEFILDFRLSKVENYLNNNGIGFGVR
jgi:hypothetical protein